MDDATRVFFYSLIDDFDQNVDNIVKFYDFSGNGDISKMEFLVKSTKLFGKAGHDNYEKIFASLLKPG
jgi:hypothetical protein